MRFLIHLTLLFVAFGLMESKYLFYKGFNYTLSDVDGDYYEALTWCTQLGGHLPSIPDEEEIHFLTKSLIRATRSSNNFMFLGANGKADGWQWHDGQPWKDGLLAPTENCVRGHSCCSLVITTK